VAEKLASSPDRGLYPYSWSKDGKILVLWEITRNPMQTDIGMLSMEGNHARQGLLQEKHNEQDPHVSPDGKWMAYVSGESGKAGIYLRPFPDVNKNKWPVSTDVGFSPLWSPDGREIFYRLGDAIMAVRVETEPTVKLGKPTVLFRGTFFSRMGITPWDISPDGRRFLMVKEAKTMEVEAPRKINVVVNWFEELKQRVPGK
jgi:Tol biopolymer transport system component